MKGANADRIPQTTSAKGATNYAKRAEGIKQTECAGDRGQKGGEAGA